MTIAVSSFYKSFGLTFGDNLDQTLSTIGAVRELNIRYYITQGALAGGLGRLRLNHIINATLAHAISNAYYFLDK